MSSQAREHLVEQALYVEHTEYVADELKARALVNAWERELELERLYADLEAPLEPRPAPLSPTDDELAFLGDDSDLAFLDDDAEREFDWGGPPRWWHGLLERLHRSPDHEESEA